MSAQIIDGKALAAATKAEAAAEAAALKAKGIEPCLAVILVGENPASQVYVRGKVKDCGECGIKSLELRMPETTTQEELLAKIAELAADKTVNGILVQLPLPKQIDEHAVIDAIPPEHHPGARRRWPHDPCHADEEHHPGGRHAKWRCYLKLFQKVS